MEPLPLLGIALGLAMDAFAVAVATSVHLGRVGRRQLFRLSFHFGLFQAFMPLLGWLAGTTLAGLVEAWDHWLAFGLLAFVGTRAILEARRVEEDGRTLRDPTRGWSLVLLSTATSLDALAVGLSFAFLDVAIWYPCLVIGLVAGGLTLLGMRLGARIGRGLGAGLRVAGGLVLWGIGLKILFTG